MDNHVLFNGDCLEVLKDIPDDSLDSLVTDPPAGISFMGKEWDKSDGFIPFMTQAMKECLRVLKPGAHGLVWAIPRTSHWTATALENAGFEIRDVVTHLFGSGFPKSLDISKAIDKSSGAEREVVPRVRVDGKKPGRIITGFGSGDPTLSSLPSTPEAKQWQGWGTALKPASEHWILVRKGIEKDLVSDIYDQCLKIVLSVESNSLLSNPELQEGKELLAHMLVDLKGLQEQRAMILRHGRAASGSVPMVTLQSEQAKTLSFLSIVLSWKDFLEENYILLNKCITETGLKTITELKTLKSCLSRITQNTTLQDLDLQELNANAGSVEKLLLDLSLQIKNQKDISVQSPASEHVLLIRKPLSEKTVAANVLKWGCGGLNIDASRIGTDKIKITEHRGDLMRAMKGGESHSNPIYTERTGRFPANLILSHNPDCVEVGTKKVKAINGGNSTNVGNKVYGKYEAELDSKPCGFGDSDGTETVPAFECTPGCAVAMLDEQSGELKGPWGRNGTGSKSGDGSMFKIGGVNSQNELRGKESGGASRFFYCAKASKRDKGEGNIHPTVKSIKLMQYLITMITPPGGTVLDPFMGSGSTGVAAIESGFQFVGVEKEQEYFTIAESRLNNAERKLK